MTLAVLALAMKVLVPQGFMISGPGSGFPLAICTGHGALIVTDDDGRSKSPLQKKSDAPCTGAANLTPITPSPLVGVLARPHPVAVARGVGKISDLLPGRGLAAPPPQSHAPPTLSI